MTRLLEDQHAFRGSCKNKAASETGSWSVTQTDTDTFTHMFLSLTCARTQVGRDCEHKHRPVAHPFSFHLTPSSPQRASGTCVQRLQSSCSSLVPRQPSFGHPVGLRAQTCGIQPDLERADAERFEQISTMSLKPLGQGTQGCLKPSGKGDTLNH